MRLYFPHSPVLLGLQVPGLMAKRGVVKANKQRIPLSDNSIITEVVGERTGIHGNEDLIHDICRAGPHFKQASNFLRPSKLSSPKKGFKVKRHGYCEMKGGDWGIREMEFNVLVRRMN